jgi:hypothetical protein
VTSYQAFGSAALLRVHSNSHIYTLD